MDVRALIAPDAGAHLGESRARVLDLLQAAGGPLCVQDIAERAGLHANTARFHLDGLVDAGLAEREPQPRETPGRPSMAYRATHAASPTGQRRYQLLAEMLASMIAVMVPAPHAAATEAGREWGRYLTERPPPYQGVAAEQAVAKLAEALEDIGFAPEAAADSEGYRLRLRQCPFREVAERHQDVVCAMHLGLLQGVLEQIRAPVTADNLRPFAEQGTCVARLSVDGAPAGRTGADPERSRPADGASQAASMETQGGETACWAHLVCPECGSITSEGHQRGCSMATAQEDPAG